MVEYDNLNGQQRRILQQYQSITHSYDIEESLRILQENDWNIENAVQNRYIPSRSTTYENDGDTPSSTSALLGNNSSSSTSRRNEHKRRFLSIFLWPFNLVWKISWNIIQFAVRLLHRPTITAPRRDPRSEADRFLRDFESTYGTTHPQFFSEGGYTLALNMAKNELKYMLAILTCEEHDDNDKFCRETLTNVELLDYLRQHQIIVWGGNVRYTEAYQVSNTLQATTYPFLAIIALQQPSGSNSGSNSGGKMSVVDRLEGPTHAAAIIRRLDGAISRIDPSLNRLRMEREQREMERRMREEQDQAYQESLRADQLKQQRLEEQREAAARAEQERLHQAQQRERYIHYLAQHLPKEEDFGPDDKITKISFRMANGDRVIRKFKGTDTILSLYEFIEAYPYINEHNEPVDEIPHDYHHQFKFTIHSTFPRAEYLPDATKLIMDEKGLWPSATLIVDTIDD